MKTRLLFVISFLHCFFLCKISDAQCINASATYTYDCLTSTALASVTIVPPIGVPPYSYTWVPSGINTASASNLGVGSYTIYVKDANNCIGFTQLIINSPYSPSSIAFSPTMVTCFGGNNGACLATFNNSGGPPFSYTWMPGGQNSAVAASLTAGTYTVTIKDNKGCTAASAITLFQPDEIKSTLSTTYIACAGNTISSAITTTGGAAPFTYTVNGIATTSNTAHGLVAGTSNIITRDNKGCLKTNFIQIQEAPILNISFQMTASSCIKRADGSATVNIPGAPLPASNYTWLPGGLSGSVISNVMANTYTLKVTDAAGCITKSLTTIPAPLAMSINPVTKPENCSAMDGGFTLSPSGGNAPYSFTVFPLNSSGISANGLSSGVYTTVITDSKGCTDSLQFNVGNLSTVSLSVVQVNTIACNNVCNGSILLNVQNAVLPVTYSASGTATTLSNVISGLCSGFYLVKAIDAAGCPATQTVLFSSPPALSYSANIPPVICIGGQAVLTATAEGGTGAITYVWNPGNSHGQTIYVSPAATTIYSLNAYDAKGCSGAPFQVPVKVNPPITIQLTPSKSGICPGSSATLEPVVSGGDGLYIYHWLPGNYTSSFLLIDSVSLSSYTIFVKDQCGSPPAVKTLDIKLFTVSNPVFKVKNTQGCEPLCTQFINLTPASKQVIWNYGDRPFEQKGDTTNYCYRKAGSFPLRITLTDSNNCKASFNYLDFIKVSAKPSAYFEIEPELITLSKSDKVLFKHTSEDFSSLLWFENGKKISEKQAFERFYGDTGCLDVKLYVTNNEGCIDSSLKSICVFEDFTFYMPSGFSPNGDGLNDVLKPLGAGWLSKNYLYEIYNRWGFKVFQTHEVNQGWNGGYEEMMKVDLEKTFTDDFYIWHVKITDIFERQHVFRGRVMLLR